MSNGIGASPLRQEDRYVGDAVAIVVAETQAQARNAAELVEVSYNELPAVVGSENALKAGAAQIHENAPGNLIFDWGIGEEAATDAAIAGAARTVSLEITNNRVSPNAMEPRAALAQYDAADDQLTLHTTSQNPHVARLVLSAFYQVAPENKLRVIAPDVGGGFGSKIYIYPEEIACLWACRKAGVPAVKWTSDRSEAFLTDAHGRDHVTTATMGFDADNKIVGFKVDTIADLGAYMSLFSSATPTYLYATLLSGQYNIPNIYGNVRTAMMPVILRPLWIMRWLPLTTLGWPRARPRLRLEASFGASACPVISRPAGLRPQRLSDRLGPGSVSGRVPRSG